MYKNRTLYRSVNRFFFSQLYSNLSNFYTKTIDRNDYATAAEFENAVDHPQIMFGKSDPFSYKLILSNNKGDTVYSGGISTIWGYCNGVDGSGNQIFMKFTGLLKHRSRNTPAAWSAWTDIITNSDLKITNATIDMGRDNTGVYMQINGINNISFLLRFDVANKALITDTMVDGVWLGKKTIASWTE